MWRTRDRVPDRTDAEDILQDVFAELVEAYRLMKPIEQVGAWLFRVARNRITDLFLFGAERYSLDQVRLFDDVIGRLLPAVDAKARARLSGGVTSAT